MKFEIMLSILLDMLINRTVVAKDLAEKYEVSIRTIYRYINSLEVAGVPLYTNRGVGGGISIVDTYRLTSTFMTTKEFNETINTLSAITNSVPNKTIESAIKKLKSVIKNEYSRFDVKSGNLIIDAGPWGDTLGYKSKLKVIQNAIDDCYEVNIRYHDRNGSITQRIIEPHIIVFKQGIWYVYAYCQLRNEFRFFKIGRIEQAHILDSKFNKRELKEEDLPLEFWNNNTQSEPVIMEIDKKYLSDIEEWIGVENIKEKDGKYIAETKLPYDGGLISKIMSFGKGIKVISPLKLKEKILDTTKEIFENYD